MTGAGAAKYPRSALQLRPTDLGRRVTVRCEVPGGFSDTLGELVGFDDAHVQIRRSSGELVRLSAADVVASRVVGGP